MNILYRPMRVFWLCVALSTALMLYDGSFWNWWSLRRNHSAMTQRLENIEKETADLYRKIEQAKGRDFIERQATEQLGLVRKGDLVFVFPDGE